MMPFSIKRTTLLFRSQWLEHRKHYTLGLFGMSGLMFMLFAVMNSATGMDVSTQAKYYSIGLIVFSSIFTSTLLGAFSGKNSTIRMLTLPVAAGERLTVAAVWSLVLFPVLFLMFTWPVVTLAHYYDTELRGNLNEQMTLSSTLSIFAGNSILQTVILAGSAFFRKFTLVKTTIIICLFLVALTFINTFIARLVVAGYQPNYYTGYMKDIIGNRKAVFTFDRATPYSDIHFDESIWHSGFKVVPVGLMEDQKVVLLGLLVPFFLLFTWFRLREKQLN